MKVESTYCHKIGCVEIEYSTLNNFVHVSINGDFQQSQATKFRPQQTAEMIKTLKELQDSLNLAIETLEKREVTLAMLG